MQPQFVAGIDLDAPSRDHFRDATRRLGFAIAMDQPRMILAVAPDTPVVALADEGLVIGTLFGHGIARPLEKLSPSGVEAALLSGGRYLVQAYWGSFVAMLRQGEAVVLLRPPFGDLPCLMTRTAGGTIVGSHIDLLRVAGAPAVSVDYCAVVRQLIAGDLRQRATCLDGIEALRGGDRLAIGAGTTERATCWSPWTFVQSDRRVDDAAEADRRLRDYAIACTDLRTSHLGRPMLLLSGGLDSSVVAACLSARGRDFACLNLMTANPIGDERDYARMVAARVDRPLVERLMEAGTAQLERLASARLARPAARSFEQLVYEIAGAAARELGCDGLVDGGGGDNIFGSVQSASPAADALLDPGGGPHFWRLCGDIGELAEESHWRVAWRSYRRSRERERPFRSPTGRRYLHPDTHALADEALRHPWLDQPEGALPGRMAHVAMLVAAQAYVEDGRHGAKQHAVSPLVSQPLIEHCLRIPSWNWFANGHNRAAARRAFEAHLPREVVWRRSKGTPDALLVGLVEKNRLWLRDHLAGGLLAGAGLIDMAALLSELDDPRPARGTECGRILQLADAESWARGITAGPNGLEATVTP